MSEVLRAIARAQAAQARSLGYRDAGARYDPTDDNERTDGDMKRYIISVAEEARVQYEVEAESEEEARKLYEDGALTHTIDEHIDSEIIDVTEIPFPDRPVLDEWGYEVKDYELANAKGRPDIQHPDAS
jgi:hypothetical protein